MSSGSAGGGAKLRVLPAKLSGAKRTRALIGAVAALSLVASGIVLVQSVVSRRRLDREIIQMKRQSDADRRSLESLRQEVAEERRRIARLKAVHDEETKRRLETLFERERDLKDRLSEAEASAADRRGEIADLRTKIAANSRRLAESERERTLAERVIREKAGGVAFVEVAYVFVDAEGKPLRLLVDERGGAWLGPDGQKIYTTSGSGPVHKTSYTGTAFLVSASGDLLTNRHVAEPWWQDEEVPKLAERGLRPRLEYLRAYFPAVPDAVPLSVVRVSKTADVALLRGDLGGASLPVLELEKDPGSARPGQPVILIGYPTGLDALLARLDEEVGDSVVAAVGSDPEKIARELARRGLIRPLATQGHLADILPNQLAYDASTTLGGSGGPVFNQRGKVIGVNASVLLLFGGASFGVPISFASELLGR